MTGFLQKVSLYFKDREHKLGELVVDAFLVETHELRSLVTERPTERGVSFVDHIYHLPLRLELTGIISNTPMTWVGLTAVTSYRILPMTLGSLMASRKRLTATIWRSRPLRIWKRFLPTESPSPSQHRLKIIPEWC